MTDPTPDRLHDELAAPPPPDGVLDAARTSALEAFDEVHGTDEPGTSAPVADLGARRARTRRWAGRRPLGAVAAAVLLVALAGVFVSQVDTDGDDDMATAALDSDDGADSDDSSAASSGAGGESAPAEESAADDGAAVGQAANRFDSSARPAFVDNDALVAALHDESFQDESEGDAAPEATTSTAVALGAGAGCDPVVAADVDQDSVLRIEPATVAGRPVLAVVYDPEPASDGDERVAIVDESSCSLDEDLAL